MHLDKIHPSFHMSTPVASRSLPLHRTRTLPPWSRQCRVLTEAVRFRPPLPDGKRAPLLHRPLPRLGSTGSQQSPPRLLSPARYNPPRLPATPPTRRLFSSRPLPPNNNNPPPSPTNTTTTTTTKMAAQNSANFEAKIKRNPHPDFKKVEASRPPFPASSTFHHVQTPDPNWKFGSGANHLHPSKSNDSKPVPSHRSIDPHDASRPSHLNYTFLMVRTNKASSLTRSLR